MRKVIFSITGIMVLFLLMMGSDVYSLSRGTPISGDKTVNPPSMRGGIARILEDAELPLTEDQLVSIRETMRGPGMWKGIDDIITPEQIKALETAEAEREKLREERMKEMQAARQERMVIQFTKTFEDAGCPLTEDQLTKLKTIDPEASMGTALVEILTDEQEAVLLDARHLRTVKTQGMDIRSRNGSMRTKEMKNRVSMNDRKRK